MPPRTATPPIPGRLLDHPDRADIRLEAVLHACADPMRLRIIQALAANPAALTCSEIELAVSKSTGTHHFRVLREAGVIAQHYQGTAKLSSLRREDLDTLFPGLLDALLTGAAAQSGRAAPCSTDPAPGSPNAGAQRPRPRPAP